MACRNSVTDYCATNACDPTLTAAEKDRSLCPATIAQCNDITAIARNSADVSTVSYYSGGQLVAVVNQLPGTEFVCQGGPEVFVIPTCSTAGQSLPVCGS